jgi:hypothetical protein
VEICSAENLELLTAAERGGGGGALTLPILLATLAFAALAAGHCGFDSEVRTRRETRASE